MVRAWFSVLLGMHAVCAASSLSAQIVTDETVAPTDVAVKLRTEPPGGIRLELYNPANRPPPDRPATVCVDACELSILPGRYLLRVSGPPGGDVRTSRRYLELTESAVVVVDPPSSFQYGFGLALGISGTIALTLGLGLGALAPTDRSDAYEAVVVTTTIAGLVAMPVGWIMFGENRRPGVDVIARAPR